MPLYSHEPFRVPPTLLLQYATLCSDILRRWFRSRCIAIPLNVSVAGWCMFLWTVVRRFHCRSKMATVLLFLFTLVLWYCGS